MMIVPLTTVQSGEPGLLKELEWAIALQADLLIFRNGFGQW